MFADKKALQFAKKLSDLNFLETGDAFTRLVSSQMSVYLVKEQGLGTGQTKLNNEAKNRTFFIALELMFPFI